MTLIESALQKLQQSGKRPPKAAMRSRARPSAKGPKACDASSGD